MPLLVLADVDNDWSIADTPATPLVPSTPLTPTTFLTSGAVGAYRVSNEACAYTWFWDPYVTSFTPIVYGTEKLYGGLVKPKYGSIGFSPKMFTDHWPPPKTFGVWIGYTDQEDDVTPTQFFFGHVDRAEMRRDEIIYRLFPYVPNVIFDESASIDDKHLGDLLSLFCGPTVADLTYTDTLLRSGLPDLDYITGSNTQVVQLNFLSQVAAYYTHLFYLEPASFGSADMELNVVDMFADNGTTTLDEFEFLPNEYKEAVPPSEVKIDGVNRISNPTYWYGTSYNISPFYGAESSADDDAANIAEILERPQINLKLPMSDMLLPFGHKLSWLDESHKQDLTCSMWVRSLRYDVINEEITVIGDGSIE